MQHYLSRYTETLSENLELTITVARSSDSNDSFRSVNKSFRLLKIWIVNHQSLVKPSWRPSVNNDSVRIMCIACMTFVKLERSHLHSLLFEWKRTTSTAFKMYYFVFHIRKKFIQVCTDVRVSKQIQYWVHLTSIVWAAHHDAVVPPLQSSFAHMHNPTPLYSNSSEAHGRGEQTGIHLWVLAICLILRVSSLGIGAQGVPGLLWLPLIFNYSGGAAEEVVPLKKWWWGADGETLVSASVTHIVWRILCFKKVQVLSQNGQL